MVRGLGQGPGKLQLVVLDSGIVASLNRTDFRNFFDTFTAVRVDPYSTHTVNNRFFDTHTLGGH